MDEWIVNPGSIHMLLAQSELVKRPTNQLCDQRWGKTGDDEDFLDNYFLLTKLGQSLRWWTFSRQIFSADKIGKKLAMTKIFLTNIFLLIIKRCDRFAIGSCSGDAAIIEIFVSEIWRGWPRIFTIGQNYRRQNGVHDIFVSIAMRDIGILFSRSKILKCNFLKNCP